MRSWARNIGRELSREETPRWWLLVGAVLSIIISTFIQVQLQNANNEDGHRAQSVQAMLDSMSQFQVYVSELAYQVNEEKALKDETRIALIKNLNDQYARARQLEELSSPELRKELSEYRSEINKMVTAVNKVQDMDSMRDFWTSTGHFTGIRNNLSHSLQQSI